jgi:NAD(P) transhydrogenase subunit alpha
MMIGIPSETFPGERRVAIEPAAAARLIEAGLSVRVESGAGTPAGFTDDAYRQNGAEVVEDRDSVLEADAVCQVRCYGANPEQGGDDLQRMRSGQILIGHNEPLTAHEQDHALAEKGVSLLAMELIPRITRAQPMDALSSQANLAGYKAVILAAERLPKMFPMMMTAAGTIKPARVFVVGAGVAGLQAIATAKRLGAVISAIDVRPEVKEQVESLGAKFIEPEHTAEGSGGYASEQTEEEKRKQQELMSDTVADSDVVITTAAVPGKKAPVLVPEDMVQRMAPGSVIVDLAAERGGNCELTEPDRIVEKHGVSVIGTTNVPSTVPRDASRMYARNIAALIEHLLADGRIELNAEDPITEGTLVCRDGEIVHPRVRERMDRPPLETSEASAGSAAESAGGDRAEGSES